MKTAEFRIIKPEIRVLGVDDGAFLHGQKDLVDVVGVVFRGGYWLDGFMKTEVEVDGFDATSKIASMVLKSSHYEQIRVVILDGVTFAGFNVVDITLLSEELKLPVISVTREKPNMDEVRKALEKLPNFHHRWQTITRAGEAIEVRDYKPGCVVYIQLAGITLKDAREIIRKTATRSCLPEALRVAHIIASGLSKRGRKDLKARNSMERRRS